MSAAERRTIDELVARYELEPSLRDLYVEGSFDKDVITACLSASGNLDVAVYEIDGVEVSAELVSRHGLTEGNKQRLVVLARELQAEIDGDCSLVCLADRDLDHWLGELEVARYLRWTSFCSIESCFACESTIRSILVDYCGTRIKDFSGFFGSLVETLTDLYTLRLADRRLGWNMTWIALSKYLQKRNDGIEFKLDTYVERLLINNSKSKDAGRFLEERIKCRELLTGDFRLFSRGHDLVELLAWSVRPFSGFKDLATVISVERAMVLLAGTSPEVTEAIQMEFS